MIRPPHPAATQPTGQSPSPYAAAIAAQLRRAPRQLSPAAAAQIGQLLGPIGPIDASGQEAGAA